MEQPAPIPCSSSLFSCGIYGAVTGGTNTNIGGDEGEAARSVLRSSPEPEDDISDFDPVFGDELDSDFETASPAKPTARPTKTLQTPGMNEAELNDSLAKMGFDSSFMDKHSDIHWVDSLLSMFSITGGLASEIHDFHLQLKRQLEDRVYSEALVDISRFRTLTGNSWDTHDPAIDILWNQLVAQVQDIMGPSFPIKHMVKPSGPMKAICHILWHYPTFITDKEDYGHVMDQSNPSLMVQLTKIGTPRTVRTTDFIPMRHEMVYSKKSVA